MDMTGKPQYLEVHHPDRLAVPHSNKRKFSFPVSLHSSSLLGDVNVSALSARRRLSNVSDVVSRKLSSTIGWKSPPIPTQDIITQGKCLCGQYIRCRLKRAGIFNKKLGLQRIRSIVGTPAVHVVREVFPALNCLGEELERMHPKLYTSVTRQISRISGGELQGPETAAVLLSAVSRDLFRNNITWGKVISLFAICGGLAVDCVRQGHAEYLPKLVDGIADVIEDELAVWLNENGGWGKCLCGQYIRARLKRAGFLNRKVTQRLRPMLDTSAALGARDIFPALNMVGEELERMHPRVYSNISRQLSRAPFGELQDANTAPYLLHAAAKELFKNEINWGKIISLFAISGGLAVDIVRQGHYDFLQRLIEGTADIIEEDLLPWLMENGCWLGLLDHIRPNVPEHSFLSWLTLFVAILFFIFLISHILRYIGTNLYAYFF